MKCSSNWQAIIQKWFYKYGYFLGSHPFWFLIIPLVICGCLAAGITTMVQEDRVDKLYAPMYSRSYDEQDVVHSFFNRKPNANDFFSWNNIYEQSEIIFRSKDKKAILSEKVLSEIEAFIQRLLETTESYGWNMTDKSMCAVGNTWCKIDGYFVFDNYFKQKLKAKEVTYPIWKDMCTIDLSRYLADVTISNGSLVSAGSLKLSIALYGCSSQRDWETQYSQLTQTYTFTSVNFAHKTSKSFKNELTKGLTGDATLFALTLICMIVFVFFVSSGGDCVSTRSLLALGGIVAVVFGIIGALGLVMLCRVDFVHIVAVMPFLTLGIGVDDMFLLMNSWSETLSITDLTLPERMGTVFKKAGIGITITSVTDFLGFVIGATSIFKSVRNFCIYTGVGVILCYFCNACVFGACLTLHGRRVYSGRHALTCQVVDKSREQMKESKESCLRVYCCGGKVPTGPKDDQSLLEQAPRKLLTKLLLWNPVRYLTLILFAGYLATAIWGCTKLQEGLEYRNVVPKRSYFYKYQSWNDEDFGSKLSVAFITTTEKNYMDEQTLKDMEDLMKAAKKCPLIDPSIDRCWLTSFANSDMYNTSSKAAFFQGLQEFLQNDEIPYHSDVITIKNESIIASRCYVYSIQLNQSTDKANVMTYMREIADSSSVGAVAYHPMFYIFEQDVVILGSTLQTVGITVAVMFVITSIFLPHPLMIGLVITQVLMIILGIVGFMVHWDLKLNVVTMIELIMSVGFSVDFCSHVCTSYMMSGKHTRQDRAIDAIVHASGPIFTGGISSLLGVCIIMFTESYIFESFFKIMLLVIGFGVLHAVVLVPVILSFIGSENHGGTNQDLTDTGTQVSSRLISNNDKTDKEDAVCSV